MTLKTILVPLDGTEASSGVLQSALTVARHVGAHIEGYHVRSKAKDALKFDMRYIPKHLQNMVLKEAEDDASERSALVGQRFSIFCTDNGIPISDEPTGSGMSASWRAEEGRVSERLAHRAQLFDLVVIAFPRVDKSRIRQSPLGGNLEALLLGCGRPILMVPAQPPATIGKRVVIGWNSSAEAARAVGDAMWCLRGAEAVTVLTSPSRTDHAEELCEHLAWRGVEATVRAIEAENRAVGAALLAAAAAVDADLMVVGGYSHARARELLLGGVTRHLLKTAEVPILMAH